MGSYIPVFALLIVTAVMAAGLVFASFVLGPKKPSLVKSTPYECGMTPIGSARERFPVKYYLVAMLFIVFDIETVFLYPWAVTFGAQTHAMKLFYFGEMGVFVAILFVGYFYILGKGALDWDEGQEVQKGDVITTAMKAPRPALRYGNEGSGEVDLTKVPLGRREAAYGASSQEETNAIAGSRGQAMYRTDIAASSQEELNAITGRVK